MINNSVSDCSISLIVGTESDHVTADVQDSTMFNRSRSYVKGQRHRVKT